MPRRSKTLPARKDDLIVQKLGEDVIVYDRSAHRAHSLNRTAALVFEKLDGRNDLPGVARHVTTVLGRGPSDEIVANAVNELAAADLLRPGASLPRRVILRGMTAALVPVITSIAVPPAASAASCLPGGDPCVSNSECCSNYCVSYGSPPFCATSSSSSSSG